MKVLIAIDGSDHCLRALTYVVEQTTMFGGTPEITLLNVHRPVPSSRAQAWVGKDAVEKYYHDEAEVVLAPARSVLSSHAKTAHELIKVGEPGHEIASAANTGFDLLVMGTHGRSEIGNLFMGSAATRALAECKVPVLLVK
jgi:nucleotide-binding universal stress UspA family protein